MAIEFPEALLTGHPVIDAQHREIVRRLSEIMDAVGDHQDREKLEDALDFFLTFIVGHFRTEEKLMLDVSFPTEEYGKHVAQHNQFTMIALMLRDEYRASGDPAVLYVKLVGIANNWLREHIIGTDMRLSEFIRERRQD